MPTCPRDDQYSSKPPPGFTDDNLTLKRVQLNDLLVKVINKYQHEPQFLEQQSKETDLLIAVAQLILLPSPISSDDKRDFLHNIVTIGQDLLTDENQVNDNEQIPTSVDSNLQLNENKELSIPVLSSNTINNDGDGDFSLEELANEYLQNESSPSSLNEKFITPSESEAPDLTLDNLSKDFLSSSPSSTSSTTNNLSNFISSPLSNEPIVIKSPLESILFSNRLSSQDAADDADGIWKEESSLFGQIFCTKTMEIPILTSKRISTCLFDRALYEHLTNLITLLPKQCVRNSVQQLSIRQNGQQQQHRPPRPNNDNRRPSNRATFQQNSSQIHSNQRFPTAQNSRSYGNSNYSYQQGNPGGHFVDRRQQQQNRYPPPSSSTQQFGNYHQQQQQQPQQSKHIPKNNFHGSGYQSQTTKSQTNSQQVANDHHHHQRGPKKASGGGSK
ncbi:unnamed protein product [Rotaria sp. Silwood1]|nr:unnamed protein product [Rotaria sp. Silwood1]CAF0956881.1 unnamed protein product [Rotaria sp. Silwood1]CAF3379293.1 unnamed protein product [Rotaria sp. Silwood1]CAF4624601.1 unnamed protein product [Rotaria sp. Silwood1]CAF4750881.1 unnamed protein product [Rotaria sp. Silwood1]